LCALLIALLLLPIKCKLLGKLRVCHVCIIEKTSYDTDQNFGVETPALNETVLRALTWLL
jgi:hypothetical protein